MFFQSPMHNHFLCCFSPAIISRTRDVKEQIRRDAFLLLAEKCNIRNFTIKERIQLLNDGLNDR